MLLDPPAPAFDRPGNFCGDQPAVRGFHGTFWCNSPVTRYAFCKNFLYFCTAFGMDEIPKKIIKIVY